MKTCLVRIGIGVACLALQLPARAAFDAFIRFSSPQSGAAAYQGESLDQQFPGKESYSALRSFDHGILQTVTIGSTSTGAGDGKAQFTKLHVQKVLDRGSPALFRTCASGGHYDYVELVLRQPGAASNIAPFYTARMKLVFIPSINWSGDGGDQLLEEVVIAYGALDWTYTRFTSQGIPVRQTVNWDMTSNSGGSGPLPSFIPEMQCPADMVVPTDPGQCSAMVSYNIMATGAGGTPSVSCDHPPGSTFPAGDTLITCTATDSAGFGTSCSFKVTVRDNQQPNLTLNGSETMQVDCHSSFTDPGATATDLCSGDLTSAITALGSVNTDVPGSYTLTYEVADLAGNLATTSRTVQVVAHSPTLSSLTPASAVAKGPAATLSVSGSCFGSGATAFWNGTPLATTFVDSTAISVVIPSTLLDSAAKIQTALITVVNLSGVASNPLVFTVVGTDVRRVASQLAAAGQSATASLLPGTAGDIGLSGTLNHTAATGLATVAVATYSDNPVTSSSSGVVFQAGTSYLDLSVAGVNSSDSLAAKFYYSSTITGSAESSLVLLFFNGLSWVPVKGTADASPAKDTTDNLDGTASGGRFSVAFSNSSTPKLTELTGTIFALEVDTTPPKIACPDVVLATAPPGACNAVVNYTVTGSDNGGMVTVQCEPVSGSLFDQGLTLVQCTATDVSGNVTSCSFHVSVADNEAPTLTGGSVDLPALWPPNHTLRLVTVSYTVSDNCSVTPFLSVTSNEPDNGSGDGDRASDMEVVDAHHVRLRAERAGTGNGRVYTITIHAVDPSGNSSSKSLAVNVPHHITAP